MEHPENSNEAIVEGYLAGGSALLVSISWIVLEPFHPLYIFIVYLIAISCISISVIWQLSGGKGVLDWLSVNPVRFFMLGLVETLLIVVFLDNYYLGKLGGVLVEAHGLIFDLIVFGIILTLYEFYRDQRREKEKNELEKNQMIKNYQDQLEAFRGWYGEEAAFRVRYVINQLEILGVKDTELTELHLGAVERETVEAQVKAGVVISCLKNAKLQQANLQKANLFHAHLQGATLRGANLKEAQIHQSYLKGVNLNGANLMQADLTQSDLTKALMYDSNLEGAELFLADLSEAELPDANLFKANVGLANMQKANLSGADLQNTQLRGVNIIGAKLDRTKLDQACAYKSQRPYFINAGASNSELDKMIWDDDPLPENRNHPNLNWIEWENGPK